MRLKEVYPAICGEGLEAGLPAIFARVQGCSVRCRYCDTPASWKAGVGMLLTPGNLETLCRRMAGEHLGGLQRVFLTGGEPTEDEDLSAVLQLFLAADWQVILQSAAPVWHAAFAWDLELTSLDVKGPAAGLLPDTQREHEVTLQRVLRTARQSPLQLKFLVEPDGAGPNWDFLRTMLAMWVAGRGLASADVLVSPLAPIECPTRDVALQYLSAIRNVAAELTRRDGGIKTCPRFRIRCGWQMHKLLGLP